MQALATTRSSIQCQEGPLCTAPDELQKMILEHVAQIFENINSTDQLIFDEIKSKFKDTCKSIPLVSKKWNKLSTEILNKFINAKISFINLNGVYSKYCGLNDFAQLKEFAQKAGQQLNFLDLVDLNLSSPQIKEITKLYPHTKKLFLNDISDADLKHIYELKNLEVLNISSPNISNLAGIEKLTNLEELILSDCPNLQEMASLSKLPNLTTLDLSKRNATSEIALPELAQLKKLKYLSLDEAHSIIEHPDFLMDISALKRNNPDLLIDIWEGIESVLREDAQQASLADATYKEPA